MFTGLIRELATVKSLEDNVLRVGASYKPQIGDSIAINGACLTVIEVRNGTFAVELSAETRALLAMENLTGKVHMEPAMRLSDRLEGHIVQGHVDTVGEITKIVKNSNAHDFYMTIPKEFIHFVVPKGSIAVDGVSLTVNSVDKNTFRLTIIPHTIKNTLFETYRVGTRVNIETDMFARYLYHMFGAKKEMSWDHIDAIMARY